MPIQLAKHFKEAHFYAISYKRWWVDYTRRLAKQESVDNVTAILSTSMETVGRNLPVPVDIAILCLGLHTVSDINLLFDVLRVKLQPQGKLVVIDDDSALVARAKFEAANKGLLHVFQEPDILKDYHVLVLQKPD